MAENYYPSNILQKNLQKQSFVVVSFYVLGLFMLEFITFYTSTIYGAIGNAVFIFLVVNHVVGANKLPFAPILPALALLSLFRLASLVMPVAGFPSQTWYVLITIPLWVAIGFYLNKFRVSPAQIGLGRTAWSPQLGIAFTGIIFSYFGFRILHPAPLFETTSAWWWATNLGVILLIAFTEEIMFRGLLLFMLAQLDKRFAILVVSLLSMGFHLNSGSFGYALFSGLVGYIYGRFALQTRSIWGVITAHFLFITCMGLLWPLYFSFGVIP